MTQPILVVKQLTKNYKHQVVLHNVSFNCTQGHIIGLNGILLI